MKTGSLFSGYGGLDLAVNAFYGSETAWHVEYEAAPSKILAHHWPDIPNHGDVTRIDWAAVEPVDILTGGYPCQPFSAAGRRQGTNDERHLWPYVRDALATLRPRYGVFENVLGHLTLGFDQVIEDLSDIGYSARWTVLWASDIGAPHHRARIFILAEDNYARPVRSGTHRRGGMHQAYGVSSGRSARVGGGADVSEGTSDTPTTSFDVWRECVEQQTRRPYEDQGRDVVMADGGNRSGGVPEKNQAASDSEDGTGRACDLAPRDGFADAARARQREAMVGRSEGDWETRPRQDVRTEPEGAASQGDSGTAAAGDTGRRGMGDPATDLGRATGDLLGAIPEARGDGGRPDLRGGHPSDSHHRERLFILVTDATSSRSETNDGITGSRTTRSSRDGRTDRSDRRTPADADSFGPQEGHERAERFEPQESGTDGGRQTFSDADLLGHQDRSTSREEASRRAHDQPGGFGTGIEWGTYAHAVRRWGRVTRPAPAPTELNKNGKPRLNAAFAEWMMGLPEGHVTSVPGLSRAEQLKAIGNGVCPPQAYRALELLHHITFLESAS